MNGLDTILHRLESDAQQEINAILDKARQEAQEIANQGKAAANARQKALDQESQEAVALLRQRQESTAQMECRKIALAAKQELVAQAFDQGVAALRQLPQVDYMAFLSKKLAQAAPSGRGEVIFALVDKETLVDTNALDGVARLEREVVDLAQLALDALPQVQLVKRLAQKFATATQLSVAKAIVDQANELLGDGQLTLSQQRRDITGGFILVGDRLEVNATLETLVRLEQSNCVSEVVHSLFAQG